jgi:hypothetical protein
MVLVEGRKVPEIAGLYGCTPANIYAILSKLRRQEVVVAPTAAADRALAQEYPPRDAVIAGRLRCCHD